MRILIAFANGIIKKITVSTNTGMVKKKLLKMKPIAECFSPVTFNMARIILSAAPLSSIDFPMIAAIAIKIPILAQVFPNSVPIRSPILLCDNFNASAAAVPLAR